MPLSIAFIMVLAGMGQESAGPLFPFVPWTRAWPLTSLEGPSTAAPTGGQRIPAVLSSLREKAGIEAGFSPRPLASPEELSAFESSFGADARMVSKTPDTADDLALAVKMREAAESLAEDSGLRRLLFFKALPFAAAGPPGREEPGDEELERIAEGLRSALWPDVPADITARVLAAERLRERGSRPGAPEEIRRRLRQDLASALLGLARFQVRNGYLDEARQTVQRALGEAPGERAALERLRAEVESRLALRERLHRLLREVEGREDDGSRWGELAIFFLSALHEEELGAAAAAKADLPALKAYAAAGSLGGGRAPLAQAEKLVELAPFARPADRPGLVELALLSIEGLLGEAAETEALKLKALRERAESLLSPAERKAPAAAVVVAVPASSAWVPSGLMVKKGGRYRISASGTWSVVHRKEPTLECDAGGSGGASPGEIPEGALVAQIGARTETIFIGREKLLLAPESGEVFFSMNERFRGFDDNSGELQVKIEGPPAGPRPARPRELLGRWLAEGRNTGRELLLDGTCRYGSLRGSWVARSPKEAVLRWSNGGIERMTVASPGSRAELKGHTGRLFALRRPADP